MLILSKESNVRIWEHYMAHASTLLFQEYPEPDMGATPFSEQDLFLNLNFFQRSYRLFYWPKAYYFFKRAKTNKIQFINQ